MRAPPRRRTKGDPFEQEIEQTLQPGSFVSYRASWSFVEGLERVEQRIAKLIRSAPARAIALYETFLAGCYEKAEELDDSSGNFGMLVENLFRGWVTARQAAGADADDTVRRLVAWMDSDPYGFCYRLERDVVKVLDRGGLAAYERCRRARFDGIATAAATSDKRAPDPAYLKRRAAENLRAIYARQRNVEAYIALTGEAALSPADCLALVEMLQARRKPARALEWVERGLALAKKSSSSSASYELADLKRELLAKLGRGDEALEAAWDEFKAHPSKYAYADLMRYVPKTEGSAWHAKAMDAAAGADLRSLIELWLETREIERLIKRLRAARNEELEALSHYVTEPIAKRLAKTHPAVAAKVYRALGMRILKAKKSKYYDAALSHFQDARGCYGRAGLGGEWQSLVREIRAAHHRKYGFMSGFEEIVAGGHASAKPRFLERAKAQWPTPSGS